MKFIENEVVRGWIYAFAAVVFILLFAFKVVTGDIDLDENLVMNILGFGAAGLAAANTSRSRDDT